LSAALAIHASGLDAARLLNHLRAAFGAEGLPVAKGDAHYLDGLSRLDAAASEKLMSLCKAMGFDVEIFGGLISGRTLRLKCRDAATAKAAIEEAMKVIDVGQSKRRK
jgi:hypothetical protein